MKNGATSTTSRERSRGPWWIPGARDTMVLIALAGYAAPFFWQLLTSLKPEGELLKLPPLLPTELTLVHYRVVLEQSTLPRALLNSLGIAVLTTGLALVLGLPAAYALARLPVAGSTSSCASSGFATPGRRSSSPTLRSRSP